MFKFIDQQFLIKIFKDLKIYLILIFLCTLIFNNLSYAYFYKQYKSHVRSGVGNTFIFNPRALQWSAVDASGRVIRAGRASGGRKYCPDIRRGCKTPVGTFHVNSMGGAGCKSSRYPLGHGGAAMPYCMFFTKLYAIHGSYEVPNYNASHGCIRVVPSDALWLRNNFIHVGTKVIVRPY